MEILIIFKGEDENIICEGRATNEDDAIAEVSRLNRYVERKKAEEDLIIKKNE